MHGTLGSRIKCLCIIKYVVMLEVCIPVRAFALPLLCQLDCVCHLLCFLSEIPDHLSNVAERQVRDETEQKHQRCSG